MYLKVLSVQQPHPDPLDDGLLPVGPLAGLYLVRHRREGDGEPPCLFLQVLVLLSREIILFFSKEILLRVGANHLKSDGNTAHIHIHLNIINVSLALRK